LGVGHRMELRLTARTRSGSVHYLVLLPHAVERPTDFVNVFMIVPLSRGPQQVGGYVMSLICVLDDMSGMGDLDKDHRTDHSCQ